MHLRDDPGTWLRGLFVDSGMSYGVSSVLSAMTIIVAVIFVSWFSNLIAKTVILQIVTRVVKRTKSTWDDVFLEQKVFTRLSHFAPAVVIWLMAGWTLKTYPIWQHTVEKLTYIYMVAVGMVVLNSFIEAWHQIYLTLTISKHRHIKGYVQLLKLVVVLIAVLIIISAVFKQKVATLIAGLGALAAVLILVFKDVILGLVASIQLSANNMLKIGDWITMPSRGVDGQVEDITLTTVKVRSFDKTIVTLPAYALVSEAFQNWKGLDDEKVRGIKRSILIDMRSIKFPEPGLLKKLEALDLGVDPSDKKAANKSLVPGSGRDQFFKTDMYTNLGLFRLYAEEYLRRHPMIDPNQTILVKHQEPVDNGLQLQFLAFCKNQAWIPCEHTHAGIMEHFLSILKEFDLKVFQKPAGDDLPYRSGTI